MIGKILEPIISCNLPKRVVIISRKASLSVGKLAKIAAESGINLFTY